MVNPLGFLMSIKIMNVGVGTFVFPFYTRGVIIVCPIHSNTSGSFSTNGESRSLNSKINKVEQCYFTLTS